MVGWECEEGSGRVRGGSGRVRRGVVGDKGSERVRRVRA